jgi:guanosine-3',5'-bis(diphosphate) 3'-pyrophosphohydrolase
MPRKTGAEAFFQEACGFAARRHRFQTRKDGSTPYVAHLMRVALTVTIVFECADRVAVLAALLHDTIEDTTTDYEDVEERFGADVADCVACLTKNMALPEKERDTEYEERLSRGPWQARLVKLADCYDNLSDAGSEAKGEKPRLPKAIEHARMALRITKDEPGPGGVTGRARAKLEALVRAKAGK